MKRAVVSTIIITLFFLGIIAEYAFATGVMIPKDESIPPLAIKYQRVSAEIKDSVAHTKIEQAFTNSTGQQLEATYIFPLPKEAAIGDFAIYINGVKTKAELVEAGKAKQVYEDIVRRMKDPALLEYMDGKLFRLRVFPIPPKGDQKVELEYSQVVDYDNGLMRYVYPLRIGDRYSSTLEEFSMALNLAATTPIRNVYSPTHSVSKDFKNEKQVVIGFEEDKSPLNRDFVLYWSFSEEDFGLNVLTRRMPGEDGYFMMMIAPKHNIDEKMIVRKDIVFVLDTSGSMQADNKIGQARKALEFCVGSLNRGDRFNIIQFATEVNSWEQKLVDASEQNINRAKEYIGTLEALGATDIDGALQKALSMKTGDERPFIIIFITDGRPTIGVREQKEIVDRLQKANTGNTRIFVFGVGYEVNSVLLDEIAKVSRGVAEYVEPKEEIDTKVSSFFAKASNPVLSNVRLSFGEGLKVFEMQPKEMPDLFKGSQLLVFGKYNGSGDYSITLEGIVNGEEKKHVYEATFPNEMKDNDFVERLWAVRRVGYLLEEVRLNGEEKEIIDEIMHLSRQYGIITPYTSFLIVEDEKTAGQVREGTTSERDRRVDSLYLGPGGGGRDSFGRMMSDDGGKGAVVPVFNRERDDAGLAPESVVLEDKGKSIRYSNEGRNLLLQKSGEYGVRMSARTGEMKERSNLQDELIPVARNINRRNFFLIENRWVDEEYKKDMNQIRIQYGSKAYFRLIELKPELKDFLILGSNLVVTINGNAIFIEDLDEMKNETAIEELEKLLKE